MLVDGSRGSIPMPKRVAMWSSGRSNGVKHWRVAALAATSWPAPSGLGSSWHSRSNGEANARHDLGLRCQLLHCQRDSKGTARLKLVSV